MTASPIGTDPQVSGIIDNLRQLSAQVKEIDNELGTDAGGPVALRNKLANEYVVKYSADENFSSFITKIVTAIKTSFSSSPELQAAVYTEIHNQLGKEFGKEVKTHLDAEVAKIPAADDKDKVSDERKMELATQRTKLVNLFKLQKEMLRYYSPDDTPIALPADIEEPSARKGAIGGRGWKTTKQYQFFVDGKHRTVKIDGKRGEISLSQIASTVAKEAFVNTLALKNFIVETLGVEVKEGKVDLGDEWEVTLPAPVNKTLKGVAVSSSNAVVDESDDSDDDDDDDENDSSASTEDDMFSGMEEQSA
jgi:hypothetical protein